MSLCVTLDVTNQPVLIIGGGKVALRKARLFLKEGAQVSILASTFLPDFTTMPVTCITKEYETRDLGSAFFVLAASDCVRVNEQVVLDANRQGKLSMSVHGDSFANTNILVSEVSEEFQLALSTNKGYPAMNQVMLQDVIDYADRKYTKRLHLLKQLRPLLLANPKVENKECILRYLAHADEDILTFLFDAISRKQCVLLCFHGVKRCTGIVEITNFLKEVAPQLPECAVSFAYISPSVVEEVNKNHVEVMDLPRMIPILEMFEVAVTLYPMLFQEGRYYNQICAYQSKFVHIEKLPFASKSTMRELLETCSNVYGKEHTIILLYHSSRTGKFASLLSQLQHEFKNMIFLHEAQELITPIPLQEKEIVIFPLYMLKGMHMKKDIHTDSLLIQQFLQQQQPILTHQESCLTQKDIRSLFMKKLLRDV